MTQTRCWHFGAVSQQRESEKEDERVTTDVHTTAHSNQQNKQTLRGHITTASILRFAPRHSVHHVCLRYNETCQWRFKSLRVSSAGGVAPYSGWNRWTGTMRGRYHNLSHMNKSAVDELCGRSRVQGTVAWSVNVRLRKFSPTTRVSRGIEEPADDDSLTPGVHINAEAKFPSSILL